MAARDEAERIADTVAGLRAAFAGARVVVADGGSRDATAALAERAGAEVVRAGRRGGKGAAATRAAEFVVRSSAAAPPDTVVLCDGDLGASASRLAPLVDTVEAGGCDLAVAVFARRQGGGFGIAVRFAGWAIHGLCGLRTRAPISGQRALRAGVLDDLVPFAPGFGMEVAMTVDAVRAGHRVGEVELDLEHRATGRDLRGFLHRGRQLAAFLRTYLSRRFARRRRGG